MRHGSGWRCAPFDAAPAATVRTRGLGLPRHPALWPIRAVREELAVTARREAGTQARAGERSAGLRTRAKTPQVERRKARECSQALAPSQDGLRSDAPCGAPRPSCHHHEGLLRGGYRAGPTSAECRRTPRLFNNREGGALANPFSVMPALVAGIHVFLKTVSDRDHATEDSTH
jgi:hypothetical protein